MNRFFKSFLSVMAVALTSWTWAAGEITEVIAINFGSDKASLDTTSEETLGYVSTDGTRGKAVALTKWNNVSGANSDGTTDVTGAMTENKYALTYSSPNTWESKEGSSTSIQKLTKGYLDVSNTGNGIIPRITLSGMPVFGYDVAVILSGDGGTFGSVSVNGINYIGDATNGATIQGNVSWGTRQGYDTLAEGQNVIYVAGLHEKTLTITGNCTTSTARASIAGLMVFFRETDETVRDFTTSTESWNEAEWGASYTEAAPTSGAVMLSSDVANGTTLTMDALPSLGTLTILGTTPVTIATENATTGKLSAENTTIKTNTTVNAGAASLGAVTVAAGKTLTVEDNMNAINSITNNGALRLTAASGHESAPVFDLTTRGALKNGSGKLLIAGENPTLVKLGQLGTGMKIEVESGTHTLRTNADSKINPSSTIDSPTIWVKSGATLHLQSKDIIGWTGNFSSDCVIRNSGALIWENNPEVSGSDCYTGQWVLDNNAVLTIARTNTQSFAWRGGSESTPNVTLTSGNAEITRKDNSQLMIHNTSTLYVKTGEASTDCLTISTPIGQSEPGSLTKVGAGTLKLTGENTAQGTLTVSNGTLDLASNWAGSVTLASSATLAGAGTVNGTLTFNAGATIDATDGAITASGTVALPADGTVTVSGTLFGGNYILKTSSASAESAAKFTVAEGYEVVADNVGYKVAKVVTLDAGATYTVTKPLEYTKITSTGAITINIADVTLDEAAVAPYLDVTGVTGEVTYTFSYIVDGVTYPCVFLGTEDALWNTTANWYSSYRQLGDETYPIHWTPKTTTEVPGAQNSNEWSALLVDGSLIGDRIKTVDNYKTVTMTDANALEGWALKLRVSNGVHLIIANLRKLQSAQSDNSEGMIYVDETSKLTIQAIGTQGNNVYGSAFTILGKLDVTGNLTVAGSDPGYNYTLGKNGHVQYAGLSGARTHKVASVTLNLGDATLMGKGIVERELVGFTSADANQTFTYEESGVSGVTNADESRTVTKKNSVAELSAIGDYCFEKRNDGYYVVYMGYAETVELTAFTATVDADGITLSEALNGAILSAKAALTIDFGETSGQFFTFNNTEALSFSSITVIGKNGGRIALGQAYGGIEYDALTLNATVSADAAFYAVNVGTISGTGKLCLASGELTLDEANTYTGGTDIAEGATLTISHANALSTSGTITGAGTLVCNAVRPANMTGLTTGTAASGETPASGWTGTVWLKNVTNNASIKEFANENASLTLEGSKGHFSSFTVKTLTLTGDSFGFQPSDGSSGPETPHNVMTIGALKGSGSLLGPTGNGSNGAFCYAYVIGDMSEFNGTLNTTSHGGRTVVWCGAAEQSVNYHNYDGKIVIAKPVAIATGKTWTAVNGITITENGTLTISEARALPVDKTVSGAGALVINGTVDLSGITGALTCALTAADGATVTVTEAQLAAFAKVTIPETATLIVKVNRSMSDHLTGCTYDITVGADSTMAGQITIVGLAASGTFSDGKLTIDAPKNPTLTGNAWWWDYEFNGNSLANDGFADNTALTNSDGILSGEAAFTTADDEGNQMLKLPARPWRNVGAWPTEATFVMYTKAGATANGMLVSFGSSQSSGKSITLMTGANPEDGDMRLVYAKGTDNNSVVDLVKNLSVPNATDAYHLYAFVLESVENNTKTQINIYVDGGLVATYTADSIIQLGGGFQIASVHGNGPSDLKHLENDDTATMDFLRVSNTVLSADAMQALANAYPYTSPNGTASREVASTDEVKNWIGEEGQEGQEGQTVWTQTTLATDGSGTTTDVAQVAPTAGSVVKVTVADTTSVALNIPAEGVSYETLDISESLAGENTLTLTAVQDAGLMTIAGKTSIKANTTIAAGAVKIGAVDVAEGKTLTFDYSAYGFLNVWTSTTIPLTGLATGKGMVAVKFPETKPAQIANWECVKDPSTNTYALVITVGGELSATIQNDTITWKIGETALDNTPADFTAWATIPMTVKGENTLTLAADITMPSVTLTRSGEGAAAVTFESGKLTVTNTLTLDDASVVATPETLSASAVTGAAGEGKTNALTMNVASGEYPRAMTLSNCSFTKDGEGTLKLASTGVELDAVNVTLAGGKLSLDWLGRDETDPVVENTTFIYVDANEDGVADGELTNVGWVHSESTVTFVVPEGITGKAFVENNSNITGACAVVKQGPGTLVLGVKTTPYTGATTISEGTLSYHASDVCTVLGTVSVAANAAIKGSAKCTLASLILENGAIIDATVAPVTATAVTLPTEEDAKVVLKKDASGDVLTYTGETPDMEIFTTATTLENAMLGVKVNERVVTLVLTQVSVPEVDIPGDATDAERAELEKQQTEAKVAAQIVADALASSTVEEIRTANVTAIENPGVASVIENAGVELIQNAGEGEETYTAKFTYDFGVSAINIVALDLDNSIEGAELYVVVKAELDDDYSFAENVIVSVTDGDNAVEGAVSVNEEGAESAPTGNTRYFRFPLPTDVGTHSYKVRASK